MPVAWYVLRLVEPGKYEFCVFSAKAIVDERNVHEVSANSKYVKDA
jgi:hypothetical protein